jgi:hypothetical protein
MTTILEQEGIEAEIDKITDSLLRIYRTQGMKETKSVLRMAVSHFAHESIEPLQDPTEIEYRIEELANAIKYPQH